MRTANFVNDTGSGTVSVLAIVASCVTLAGVLLPFVGLVVVHERAQSIADHAALVAADTLHGAITGVPCDAAGDVVAEVQTDSWSCELDRGDAFISLSVPFGPVRLVVRSRAGIVALRQ